MRVALLVALAACARDPVPPPPPSPVRPPAATAVPVLRHDAPSIYELPVRLRSAEAHEIGLDAGRGHLVLASMFYGSCAAACPVLVDEIGRVMSALHDPQARVLLISFDAARDTPSRLRELAAAHHLDGRWILASADDADARAIAAVLDIKYRKLTGGAFAHSSAIVALDEDGRPVARVDGLGHAGDLAVALRGR